ncbi:MAG: hypothetical protein HUJ42_01225 [Malacoplasma sp.]|nr:hypothetical protein [Malacoplasma sp.]
MDQFNWDLESLLGNKSVAELFEALKLQNEKLLILYESGECYSDLNKLKNYLVFIQKSTPLENKLFNFISNKLSENVVNNEMMAWETKISNYLKTYELNYCDEINQIFKYRKAIESFINQDKELFKYKKYFDSVFRYDKHRLKENEQKLLTKLSPYFSIANSVFTTLVDSEIKLLPATNKNGKQITFSNISEIEETLQKSNDRILRKNAYISQNRSYINFENTLSSTLFNFLSLANESAKIHKFKDYIDSVCFDDEVNTDFINFVYDQVSQYKSSYQKYLKLENKYRIQKMKVDKVEPWDKYFDIYTPKEFKNISVETAQKIILEALSIMGKEYIEVVQKAFAQNWISWFPAKNKVSGAYTIGDSKGLEKIYMLVNYDNCFSGVSTIVHEMGHALNAYYTNKQQDIYYENEIFDAEIASIVNEILLSLYLIKKYPDNKNIKLLAYSELIENFFATTTRQIMFSYTEKTIIDEINKQNFVGAKEIKEIYANSFVEFAGFNQKRIKQKLKQNNGEFFATIFRISHFYDGIFYVYKYAIGMICAILCATKIYQDKAFLNQYIKFLSLGNSLSPIDKIKQLGIDLYEASTWNNAFKVVENWINEYEKLTK